MMIMMTMMMMMILLSLSFAFCCPIICADLSGTALASLIPASSPPGTPKSVIILHYTRRETDRQTDKLTERHKQTD